MGEPAVPGVVAKPAATVVMTRDGDDGVEVLLVKRSGLLTVHGGAWAFPGGSVERSDVGSGDVTEDAKRAAVREVFEETGISISMEDLTTIARWVTPQARARRFDANFFHVHLPAIVDATADGSEIVDVEWVRPTRALTDELAGHRTLPGPTAITLRELASHSTSRAVAMHFRARAPREFEPRTVWENSGVEIHLYRGDAGFFAGNPEIAGPRNRMIRARTGMRYEWSEEALHVAAPRLRRLFGSDAGKMPVIAWDRDGSAYSLQAGERSWDVSPGCSAGSLHEALLWGAQIAEWSLDGVATAEQFIRTVRDRWSPHD